MGMFDYVNYECVCPACHTKVDGFQSKDSKCNLDQIDPSEVDNFYSDCKCGKWLEFDRVDSRSFKLEVSKDWKTLEEFTKVVRYD